MGVDISDKYVVINYKIPYNGMVEISLFDKEGEKVWANQYPNNSGENRIALKLAAFKQGTTYAYTLNYKTDQVKETLIIPATTSNKFGYGTTYQEYPLN